MLTRRVLLTMALVFVVLVAFTTAAHAGKPSPTPTAAPPTPPPNPQILYYDSVGKGKTLRQGIWQMNADGSNKTFVWPFANGATWSPDGNYIVLNWFQAPAPLGYGNIFRIDADGTDPLLLDPYGAGRASWSPAPEGSATHDLVAYTDENDPVDDPNDCSLMMVDGNGGTPQQVLQGNCGGDQYCAYGEPEWSRDGQVLVVVASCDPNAWPGYRSLLVVPPLAPDDRYVLLNLATAGYYPIWLSWARQHDWLAFTAPAGGTSGTYRHNLAINGAGRYVIASTDLIATSASHAVWSPDDSKLAFNATGGLYTHDLATGTRTLIGPGGMQDWRR